MFEKLYMCEEKTTRNRIRRMKDIKLEHEIVQDDYTSYVHQAFDITNTKKTQVIIPMGEMDNLRGKDWNIGVIYGGSGKGKTTILKKIGEVKKMKVPTFDDEKSLISNFDWLSPEDATRLLSYMGLSTVPSWLRPYGKLSNGEQYRARLAWLVSKAEDGEVVLVDEYTSVVDRDVAKSMSYALQKYMRSKNKRIILASVHYDIMEWLLPDWVFNLEKGGALERGDRLWQSRPEISLQVHRTEFDTWKLFKEHHYLTHEANNSSKVFVFTWNDIPVATVLVLQQPSGHFDNGWRESRIVVLPQFQGLGLGYKISCFMGAIFKNSGMRYFTKTVHPALGEKRNMNSDVWRATSKNGKSEDAQNPMGKINGWNVLTRTSFCHEYEGDPISGYDNLLQLIDYYNDVRERNKLLKKSFGFE